MQDLLGLVDELRAFSSEAMGTQTILEPPRHDRWLLRSALQKAVRRGQTDTALWVGDQLRALEPDYFWSALAVIAVEDIGFGDPDLITFSTAAKSKTVGSQAYEAEATVLVLRPKR